MDKMSRWYDKLEQNLYNKQIFRQPKSIQINLLNKCYQKCLSCRKYQWPHVMLSQQQVFNIIDFMENQTIVFSGGEPLLYPNILEVLRYCKQKHVELGILSSAMWPSSLDIVEMMKHIKWISISFDSSTKEGFKKIRGVDGFDLVLKNIKKLKELNTNVRIRVNSTISRMNCFEIPDIIKTCDSLGVECFLFPLHTWDEYKLDETEARDSVSKAMNLNISINTNISNFINLMNRGASKHCIIPQIHLFIDANGDVIPCCRLANDNGNYEDKHFICGNVNEQSLEEIWNSDRMNEARDYFYNVPNNVSECQYCDRYNEVNKNYDEWLKNERIFL